jgi:hypothetical protein
MDDITITIYCLCEEFLEAIGHRVSIDMIGWKPSKKCFGPLEAPTGTTLS